MLTSELLRNKIAGDRIYPEYIKRSQSSAYLRICEQIIQLFQNSIGKPQQMIREALEILEGERTDYKVFRGLAKLLEEETVFQPSKNIDFQDLRRQIFLKAQKYYPIVTKSDLLHRMQRNDILSEIAVEFNVTAKELDILLYGDLPQNQILTEFNQSCTPEKLLKRYNLALAQGLLYRAREMRIILKSDFRTVFQYMKLAGLMHLINPIQNGYEIQLNGPASLHCNTLRYGIRMANFLPGLILAKNWSMVADIQAHREMKQFHINSGCGLTSHYTRRGPFDSQIEKNFYEKYSRKKRSWTIERESDVIDLGETIFIPDFTFKHSDGRKAYLEIIGFWTRDYLEKKLKKIQMADPGNLILAVNKQLNCSREDFPGEVIFYRNGIKIKDVLERLETIS